MKYNTAYSPVNMVENDNQRLVQSKKRINQSGKRTIREDLIITKLLRKII